RVLTEAGRREIAGGEIPDRLAGQITLAVAFLAARAAARRAGVDEHRRRGGRVVRARRPVLVADAGAGEAGVAVPTANPRLEEPAADARAAIVEEPGDVGVGLGRVVEPAAVVLVQAVADLVRDDGRDLAGAVAAAAGAEHVELAAAPVRVAGLLDVHVLLELGLEPGVRGKPGAPPLLDPVEREEAGPRGLGVSGGRAGGHRAVVPRAQAEAEVGVTGA